MTSPASRVLLLFVLTLATANVLAVCPPSAPVLTSPAENAVVPFGNVNVDWDPVAGAETYDVWIALDGDGFSSPTLTVNHPASQGFVNIDPGRAVAWKVTAKAPSCTDQTSSIGHFETNCPTILPTLLAPEAGASFGIGETITFDWTAAPGAVSYDLKVTPDHGQTWIVFEDNIVGTSLVTGAIAEGDWGWQIRANYDSCAPLYSAPSHFLVSNCDQHAPSIVAPANGSTVKQPFELSWTNTGAPQYRIWMKQGDSTLPRIVGTSASTSIVISGLEEGVYSFGVSDDTEPCADVVSGITVTIEDTSSDDCPAAPGKATLLSPAEGATNLSSPVTFNWSAVSGAKGYRVLASFDGGAPETLGLTTETSLTAAVPKGSGYWIVQTFFGEECPTTLSDRRALTVSTGASCNNAPPQLTSPANGATGVQSPVTFQWSAVPSATSYTLYVGIGDDDELVPYGFTTTTSISRLVPRGMIYWQVEAQFGACDDVRSAIHSFTAGAATDCPTGEIVLNGPADGAEVDSPVRVTWTAVAGVQAYRVWVSRDGSAPTLAARTTSTEAELALPRGKFVWFVEGIREDCTPIVSDDRTLTVKGAADCATRPTPSLVSPVGTEENPAAATNPVTLKWNAAEGAIAYRAWISEEGEPFGDLDLTNQTQVELDLDPGEYAWYVQALFPGCDPVAAPTAWFTIDREGSRCPAAPPSLVEPAGGAVVDGAVTFRWTAVDDAAFYRVYAARDGEEPALVGRTDDTQLTRVLPPGSYAWAVEAVFKECPSTRSAGATFSIARSSSCPTTGAELLSPAQDEVVTTNPVELMWAPVSGAIRYAVVARIGEGAETLLGTTEETHLTHRLPPGLIQWRVLAFFRGCDPVPSPERRFRIPESENCQNRRPLLRFPESGATVPSPLRMAWTEVQRATGYRVWVVQTGNRPSVVATTTNATASVTLPPGRYEWFVEATFENCPSTVSAVSEVIVTAPLPCGTPGKPQAQVVGQALSNTEYRLRWTPLPNVGTYEVQESMALNFAIVESFRTSDVSMPFSHEATSAPVQYLYRVRGVSNCSDARGPYSDVVGVFVIPARTNAATTEAGTRSSVVQTLFVPGGSAPIPFTATTDKPWLKVEPESGTLPPAGINLTVTADPSVLDLGTNTGTVQIQYASGSNGLTTHATSAALPVSVSLVTPVLPSGQGTPPPDALIFPAVAHAAGANDSLFESDIRVTNLTASTMKYELHFTPSGVDGTQVGTSSTIELAPGDTLAMDDIVASLFGSATTNITGMLELRPITTSTSESSLVSSLESTALKQLQTVASSRTYNFTPNGTYGQFIPAIPFSEFAGRIAENGAANILSLQQIAQSNDYRSNFGFAEAAGEAVDLTVRVFDTANTLLATIPVSLGAREHRQINGMLGANGIATLNDGRVEVEVTSGNGKVTAYASTVDNRTNDPLMVSATRLGETKSNRYVVPGMAFIENAVAFWVSDLRIFNSGSAATAATLNFHPIGNPGAPVAREIAINPGEIKVLDNLVSTFFGQPNGSGGSVAITTPNETSLVVTARTYNETPNGTYGQFIPGVTPAQSAGAGDRALQILQLEQSSRFRTNVGVTETSGQPATVEISVIIPDSLVTPVVQMPLAANEFRQISLADFGLTGAVYNVRATVKVIEGNGRVTAYGSAIDLVTQDPTYVPAQ